MQCLFLSVLPESGTDSLTYSTHYILVTKLFSGFDIDVYCMLPFAVFLSLEGDTNQLMGKAHDWNMCEPKLKKCRRWVLHTANKDCNGGEDDVQTLPDGSKDGSSGGSDDHDGHEDHGAVSEDSDDEIIIGGPRVVQLLSIRANFSVRSIHATDWILPQHIYGACEGEVQEVCTRCHVFYVLYTLCLLHLYNVK